MPGGGYVRPVYKRESLKRLAASLDPSWDKGQRSYGLALKILEFCFGQEWMERHIYTEPADGFLGRALGSEEGSSIVVQRIINLAEMIANLASIHGHEACLEQIAGGMLEPGYAELEVGKMIFGTGVEFSFILPSGVAGESFDLEITFPNGRKVCADTKCQLETREFAPKSLRNRLDDARKKNLPKGRPGAIFVKIPQEWRASEDLMSQVEAVCRAFLRGTKRVVYIGVYSSLVEVEGGVTRDWLVGTEFRNTEHDFDPSLDWRLLALTHGKPATPPGWCRLVDLCEVAK